MASPCHACQYENADHARFCARCGQPLAQIAGQDPLLGALVAQRFRIVRVIGEGGMGRVYYAEQQLGTTSRPVALKVLRGGHDGVARERFVRECEVLVQLTHPNTIRVYDFGELPDHRLFLAMEYVEGRTLSAAIREGPLPLPLVERFVSQIGGALAEAHRRGIVHRDLKPDNVLLADDPDEGEFAKVLDFGIAKRADTDEAPNITSAGLVVGTPAYMSPEQFAAKPLDARADVYALGLITFEMLTGSRPFTARSALEWATAHMTQALPSFDDYPATRGLAPARRIAILHALEKDPDERTASARRFVSEFLGERSGERSAELPSHELRATHRGASRGAGEGALLGDAPTAAATPSVPMTRDSELPLAVPMRRSPLGPLALLAALMLLAAAAFFFFRSSEEAHAPEGLPLEPPSAIDGFDPANPRQWFRMVTGDALTRDVTNALGPPDGQCAAIEPGGKILLELEPGFHIHTDGTPAADLRVVVVEPSAPYRVDVLVVRHEDAVSIGADVVGSMAIDVDQFDQTEFRYIRIKNRNEVGEVCVDAVGVLASLAHDELASTTGN